MYIRNLDSTLQLSSHLFPDYYTQNNTVMSPNVILSSLIRSEYDKPFHPYMVVCREEYFGTVLQAEIFAIKEAMVDDWYKKDWYKSNSKKTHFYCHREEFMRWILQCGYDLDPKLTMLASLPKHERLVYQLQENVDNINNKKTFYVKNFVNAGQSFYHIAELTKMLFITDAVLHQSILDFTNFAIKKVNSVLYIDNKVTLMKLNEIKEQYEKQSHI